ncbi:hypothetical protein BJ944DRAFT_265025, partial [Cunninghamella echinulata]
YFEKTFEVYTKLWKFQQTHRPLLEDKNNYGLKRWEVGEIASKIGQLYYHYYLRTSETNYLNEAYVFYEAIHDRQYFKNILEVKNPALMIKKMRYYARFIVVCLLLNKDDNIRLLISELEMLIDEYTKAFKPPDAKEWQLVLQEITAFMEAEKKIVPINTDRTQVPIQHRLPNYRPIEKKNTHYHQGLRLQEAILVGNYQNQIKFSELTLDMYRILQSLEREPNISTTSTNTNTTNSITNNNTMNTKSQTRDLYQTSLDHSTPAIEKKDPLNALGNTKESTSSPTSSPSTTNQTNTNALSPSTHHGQQQENKIATSSSTTLQHGTKRSNPHKYLLYRPTFSQLMVYIATAFKDTSDNSVMLLYISADGCLNETPRGIGFAGGVATSQRKSSNTTNQNISSSAAATATNASAAAASGNTGTGSSSNLTLTTSNTSNNASSNNNTNSNNIANSNSSNNNNIHTTNNSTNPTSADMNQSSGLTVPSAHQGNNSTSSTSGHSLPSTAGNNANSNINNNNSTTMTTAATASSTIGGGNNSGGNNLIVNTGSKATTASTTNTATTSSTIINNANNTNNINMANTPPSISSCLYPADLIPFTRKPLFLIIDSDNSLAFQQTIPNLFDQPVMCLLSPTMYPSSVQDKSEIGSLFTLFLHTPLLGFCSVSDIGNLEQTKWNDCVYKVDQLERTIGKLLLEDPDLDDHVKRFMTDDFLWTIIVRFVLCGIILRCHSSFKNEKSFPSSSPPIPEGIYTSPELMSLFDELTLIAEVDTYFNIPRITSTPTPSATTVTALQTNLSSLHLPSAPTSISNLASIDTV